MKLRIAIAILLFCSVNHVIYGNESVDLNKMTTASLQINIPINSEEGQGSTGSLRLILRPNLSLKAQQAISPMVYCIGKNLYAINYAHAQKLDSTLIYRKGNNFYLISNLLRFIECNKLFDSETQKPESVFVDLLAEDNQLLEINVKYANSNGYKKYRLLSSDGIKYSNPEDKDLMSWFDFPLHLNPEGRGDQGGTIDLEKILISDEYLVSTQLTMSAPESINITACFDYVGIINQTAENKEKSLLGINMKSCTTNREPYLVGKGKGGTFFLMMDCADYICQALGDKHELNDGYINIDQIDGSLIKIYSKIFSSVGQPNKRGNYVVKMVDWDKLEYVSGNVQ